MSQGPNTAIVLNCGYNGLSLIQDLGRRGIECVAMDSVRTIGTFSRYAEYVRCPDPAIAETRFVEFLFGHCSRLPVKPVLFPTNDHWAMAVSRHKERLAEVSIPCVADWPAMRQVIEKAHFYRIGAERGYGTPLTLEIADLRQAPPEAFPLAAKPQHRRVAADADDDAYHRAMDRLRLVVIQDQARLTRFLREEERWLPHLVFQRYVPGLTDQMRTVGIYADENHQVRAVFTGRKVRGFPADIGDCVVGESAALPETLLADVQRIVSDIGLSGICEFEYKYDATRDQHVLIEVNPRSWSWVGITSAAGVELPWRAYADLIGHSLQPDPANGRLSDGAIRYAKVVEDAVNTVFRYSRDHPAWRKGPLAWWRDLHSAPRVVYAEFQPDDAWVAVEALFRGLKTLAGWWRERLKEAVQTALGRRAAAQPSVERAEA